MYSATNRSYLLNYKQYHQQLSFDLVFYRVILQTHLGSNYPFLFRGKKDEKEKKRRRKMKTNTESEDMDQNEENEDGEEEDKCLGDNLEKMKVDEEINTDSTCSGAENMAESEAGVFKVTVGPQTSSQVTTYDDGIFTVTMGPQGSACGNAGDKHNEGQTPDDLFIPCKRMNALMTVKHGVLYLYGGIYEIGDKQVTLADMYALDLHKLDEWKTILADDISSKVLRLFSTNSSYLGAKSMHVLGYSYS